MLRSQPQGEENGGWFHYEDGTTGLFGVARSAVDADLAELAGVPALIARAQGKSDPLAALHLLEIALATEPANAEALTARKAALERLAAATSGSNLSETMWLKAEIADADAKLAAAG